MVVITYDVDTKDEDGKRRLRVVAKQCQHYGQRVQNSVFECLIDAGLFSQFKQRLIGSINSEKDSLRFYFLGNEWRNRIEHIGAKPSIDLEGPLIA